MLDEGEPGAGKVVEILDRRQLVCQLATQSSHTSRLVQRTLDEARQDDGLKLARQLEGNVAKLIHHMHGNYVLQAVIEQFPLAQISFVVEEMLMIGKSVAQSKIGCRSVLRLVERYTGDDRVAILVSTVLASFSQNVSHPYAHHVLEALLEHGQAAQKREVVNRLKADFHRLSRDATASYVIEKALTCSSVDGEDRQGLISIAMKAPAFLVKLAKDRCGHKIVRALKQTSESRDQVKRWLEIPSTMAALGTSKLGRRFYSEAGVIPDPAEGDGSSAVYFGETMHNLVAFQDLPAHAATWPYWP